MQAALRRRRRQRILEAAIRVFARKGYRDAAVADIIREARISHGAFYLYFKSKAAAFEAILEGFLEGLRRLAEAESKKLFDPRALEASIHASLAVWLRHFHANRDVAALVFREAGSFDPRYRERLGEAVQAFFRHWESQIAWHQRLGVTRPDVEPEFVRVCLTGMFAQIVTQYLLQDAKPDFGRLAAQWQEVLSRGVLVRRGEPA